jgi:hypothetical protein
MSFDAARAKANGKRIGYPKAESANQPPSGAMLSIRAGDIPVKMKKQEPLCLFGERFPYFLIGASLLEDSR